MDKLVDHDFLRRDQMIWLIDDDDVMMTAAAATFWSW